MITVLDTSSLIRFFTNDLPGEASLVKQAIETKALEIPDVVFPELEYVLLSKTYNATRERILIAFQFLASRKNIKISTNILKAISLYRLSNLDIADCLIAATAQGKKLLTFDKRLSLLHKQYK